MFVDNTLPTKCLWIVIYKMFVDKRGAITTFIYPYPTPESWVSEDTEQ